MAERIVSPGVFTRERDLSFLPQGIAEIGAAIIGPTLKGPAFVPTIIRNFPEFEEMFGSTDKRFYTPYAVEQYLRSAGQVTIVRVLNTSGYTADSLAIKIGSTTAASPAVGSVDITNMSDGDTFTLVGLGGTSFNFIASDAPVPADVGNTFYFVGSSSLAATGSTGVVNLAAKMTAVANTIGVTAARATGFLHISASSANTAGNSFTFTSGSTTTTLTGGAASVGSTTLAILAPSRGGANGAADLEGSTITGNWASASLVLSGSNWGLNSLTSRTYTFGFHTGSTYASYIDEVFSTDAQVAKSGTNTVAAYLYKNFKYEQSGKAWTTTDDLSVEDGTISLATTYDNACTPSIQSQTINNSKYTCLKLNLVHMEVMLITNTKSQY
jgi:hypothetical protein